jgi:hypothetical protein
MKHEQREGKRLSKALKQGGETKCLEAALNGLKFCGRQVEDSRHVAKRDKQRMEC